MSIQDSPTASETVDVPEQRNTEKAPSRHIVSEPTATVRISVAAQAMAVLRIIMGLTLLWAFLDKTFGLGYATTSAQAWINGGSPTRGFLAHVYVGPMQDVLRSWAGAGWADWLFMLALLGIGLALLFGVGMRLAATAGTILLAFMWIAEWPLARHTATGAATSSTNPLIDYHLVYIAVIIVLALFATGETWGFGKLWAKLDFVRRNPWLR